MLTRIAPLLSKKNKSLNLKLGFIVTSEGLFHEPELEGSFQVKNL